MHISFYHRNRILKIGSLTDQTGLRASRISYCYDKKNQLTKETYDGEAIHYHYDLCGNRLEKKEKNRVERYTYNSKNQLVSRISNLENVNYQYDLQGNVLKATGTDGIITYGYNAFNQQTSVSMPDGSTLENYYDAEYLRAGTVENGKARSFLYYNGELLAESNVDNKVELGTEDTILSRYILGYGVAIGWNQERKGYHSYHLDEQNSTAYVTDEAGIIQNSYQYGAFGDIRNQQENFQNRILYTGQQYDQVSGQYYLRARFYNPVVGRFLQEDVYRGDGLNLYAYCGNNPVMYYDPSGYQEKCTDTNSTINNETIDNNGITANNNGTTTHNISIGSENGRNSLPQGISQEQFSNASKLLRDRVGNISGDIVVQGSRAKGTAKPTSDIDIALRVSGDKFDSLINQYFKTPNPGSAKERTMLHAIKTGKIQAGEAKLSGLRKELQEIFGMEVDISIIKQGGAFDNPPFIPFE